jgi:ketosteroid isomerase-like protein
MKTSFWRLLPLLALLTVVLRAADTSLVTAVRAADDERVAATKAGDRARLEAIYSDDLRYAHSSGKIDTKASYINSLVTRSTVYETYDYQQRDFKSIAPGVVLMTGRVLIRALSGGQTNELDLNFLAVWREEQGHWRFVAWQSARNPPPAAAK